MKRLVWNSMLDADMSTRYWGELVRRYSAIDFWLRVLLAVLTSGVVAVWFIDIDKKEIWQSLSFLSAVLAIVLSTWRLNEKINTMARLVEKCSELKVEYEDVWQKVFSGVDDGDIEAQYKFCKRLEMSTIHDSCKLPKDKKLIQKCFDEVLKSRGLERR